MQLKIWISAILILAAGCASGGEKKPVFYAPTLPGNQLPPSRSGQVMKLPDFWISQLSLKNLQGKKNFPDLDSISGPVEIQSSFWNKETPRKVWKGHEKEILCLSFSPQGKWIASGSRDNLVILWDSEDGHLIKTFNGHSGPVHSVAFSPDEKTLISGSEDNTIKLWDIETGREIRTLKGHEDPVYSVTFSPGGEVVSGSWDAAVYMWRAEKGEIRKNFYSDGWFVFSVAFSPDGKVLASGNYDKEVYLWDVETRNSLGSLLGHKGWVRAVAFSPNGKILASGSEDRTVCLWDWKNKKKIRIFENHESGISSLHFSRDGKILVCASGKKVYFWNVEDGKLLYILESQGEKVTSVAFSPANGLVAFSAGKEIYLRKAHGYLVKMPGEYHYFAELLTLSPGSHFVSFWGEDENVYILDLLSGNVISSLSCPRPGPKITFPMPHVLSVESQKGTDYYALSSFPVDLSPEPSSKNPIKPSVEIMLLSSQEIKADGTLSLKISIDNSKNFYALNEMAVVLSPSKGWAWNGDFLLLGKIPAGEKKSFSYSLKIEKEWPQGNKTIEFYLSEGKKKPSFVGELSFVIE